MTKRWLLVGILALAAFLRLFQLSTYPRGLYFDEAMDGNNAMEALETHRVQVFYPEDNGREGLYVNVAALSIATFGHTAWALRLPAAAFGVLTVWGLYLLAAEWLTGVEALLASFFLATSFWHLMFSRLAFRAIAAPLFLVWSLYFLLVALKRARVGRAWAGWMALAGAVYGLGFYTYLAYRVTPLLVVAVWLALSKKGAKKGQGKSAWLFAAVAGVVAAPLGWYFLGHPADFWGRASQVSVWSGPRPVLEVVLNFWRTGRMLFTRGDHNWRHNVGWRAEVFWPVAVCFVVGAWLAVRKLRVAWVWLLLAMAPATLATEAPHALRAILMTPVVCLMAAMGARWIWDRLAAGVPVRILQVSAAALLLGLCYEPYHAYFDVWAGDPKTAEAFDAGMADLARRMDAAPAGTLKLVVADDSGAQVHGLPVELEPLMFLTGSYTERQREDRRIRYEVAKSCPAEAEEGVQVFCLPRDKS